MGTRLIFAMALVSLPLQRAAAAEPKRPTGPWTVDIAANECLLIRPYGTPSKPLFLAVSKAPMDSGSQFTILYNRDWANLETGDATISFDGGPSIRAKFASMLLKVSSKSLKVDRLRSVTIGQDTEKPEPLAREASAVSIVVPKEMTANFALPDQAAALKELNDCATKLGVQWGYPFEEQRRLAEFSKHPGGLGRLFSADDYPPAALRRDEMGRVRVRIRVSDAGEPADCTVTGSSGSADLDKATCDIIRTRAKFTPAVDVDGKPVRSVYTSTVNWVLVG